MSAPAALPFSKIRVAHGARFQAFQAPLRVRAKVCTELVAPARIEASVIAATRA